jgi:CBS domain-containing protein
MCRSCHWQCRSLTSCGRATTGLAGDPVALPRRTRSTVIENVETALAVSDIWYALRQSAPLSPHDSLAKAARLFRARNMPALVVAQGPQLLGIVRESDVLRLAAEAPDPAALIRTARVAQAVRPIAFAISTSEPLVAAAAAMGEQEVEAAPVVDPSGRYVGMLLRRDVLAALEGQPVVGPIAGLATPLGVHLTTGALRAGAGDVGLALTGVMLMAMSILSMSAVTAVRDHWHTLRWLVDLGAPVEVVTIGLVLAQVVLFLLLLRFSPIPGIHAGEHMVVHAIEEGEDLTLEKVRPMPRAHPRCGTNLVALLMMVAAAQQLSDSFRQADSMARDIVLYGLVVIVVFTWRRLGHGLQRWITTRTPSDRQLQRAVEVGQELLRKVSENPGARAKPLRRLWNAGFLQVMLGAGAVMVLAHYALGLL